MGPEAEHKSVVPGAEVGVDRGGREGWGHGQVGHHRIRVNGDVEGYLKVGVRVGGLLPVAGIRADDARQRYGGELPLIILAHPFSTGRALHPTGDAHLIGLVESQHLGRLEDQGVGEMFEGALDLPPDQALGFEAESVLGRPVVYRLVEGDPNLGRWGHQGRAVVGRGPDHTGRLGAEGPPVVFLQEAAGGVGEAGFDAGGVSGAAGQGLVGGEDVDGGIEPLAAALDRRVKDHRPGQILLLLQSGQGHHGPVEHHGDGAVGLHVLAVGGGDDLGHFQIADGGEVEAVSFGQGHAGGVLGSRPQLDLVPGGAGQGFGRPEAEGALVGPLEASLDFGADAEGPFHCGLVHGPVKDQLDDAVEGQLLTALGRALDDDGRGGAGRQPGGVSEQGCRVRLGRWSGQRRKAAAGCQKQTGYDGQCEGEIEAFHCRFLLSVDGIGDAFCSIDVGVGGKVPSLVVIVYHRSSIRARRPVTPATTSVFTRLNSGKSKAAPGIRAAR